METPGRAIDEKVVVEFDLEGPQPKIQAAEGQRKRIAGILDDADENAESGMAIWTEEALLTPGIGSGGTPSIGSVA